MQPGESKGDPSPPPTSYPALIGLLLYLVSFLPVLLSAWWYVFRLILAVVVSHLAGYHPPMGLTAHVSPLGRMCLLLLGYIV